jgi:hypothetical protein
MWVMKKIIPTIALLISIFSYSQKKKVDLIWKSIKTLTTEETIVNVPYFTPESNYNYSFNNNISYVDQWVVSTPVDESSIAITNIVYAPIAKEELKDLKVNNIPNSIEYTLKNTLARDKKFAVLRVSPIVRDGLNNFKKISSFTINYKYKKTASTQNRINNLVVTNSVLNTGTWYRFAINKTGVFKLNKDFLNSLGINTNTVNPKTIKIFGSGGKMLPYANNENYPLDPVENAIKVIGEEDGVFNINDYVLFYGEGPFGDIEDETINTHLNPYTDVTYYYITTSGGNGKRIQPMIQPTGAVDMMIDTFNDYQFHEADDYSLALVGRRWFGDEFDIETTKTFDFNFPNLITTEPLKLKVIAASSSVNGSNLAINVNEANVGVLGIPGVNQNLAAEGMFEGAINTALSDDISIRLDFDNLGNPSSKAYLDYIAVEGTRGLAFAGNQFQFSNKETTTASGVGLYTLNNSEAVSEVWNVTDINNVTAVENTNATSSVSFKANLGSLKTFATVSSLDFYEPLEPSNSRVVNQNIKGAIFNDAQGNFQDVDYIIVTPSVFFSQAERLAEINRNKHNLNVKIVLLESIYTEFSTGNKDIAAIRNMVKYVYDNASAPENRLKYLCFFGDSSFDYKERIAFNTYYVPTWNAYNSFNLTTSFVSDDFYGMMDENEGSMEVSDLLDINIGRILADTPLKAKQMVDKIETYYSKEALGSWRNNFVVISDDVDEPWETLLQETTDMIGNEVTEMKPFINTIKIHTDAFQQESSAGGDRYPEVANAISNAIESGALVVNYFGHGGEDGFAFERIFQKPDAANLRNECQLNCFVTVTCEYTKFDNPLRETAGELVYWNKNGGSIAMITTTRQILVPVGVAFNVRLEEYLFSYSDNDNYSDYEYPTMAEALRLTKNSLSNELQRRMVFFIGDPAMKLAFPKPNVRLKTINGVPVDQAQLEVIEALSYAKLEGEVTDLTGNVLTNYNGEVTTTIYDKPIQRQTLGNDNIVVGGEVAKLDYETLGAVVFRGKSSVVNGQFELDFIVPKDIALPVGYGKVSFYAAKENTLEDQSGATTTTLQIGGLNENAPEDNTGPLINLFMNDETFASGGITNESPNLLVKLEDENGINTASGIGHDIVAILDGDEVNPFILNNYYTTEINNYKKGNVSFPFRDLEPGIHTLKLKAWDVYNNASTAELQFVVFNERDHLIIENVLNYPNPFVNYTEFWFNHNSSEILDISIQIFTVSGKLVKTLNGQSQGNGVKSASSTSRDIIWDGRDDFGDKIGKGTYVYKLTVHSSASNKTVEKIEKLVIL